MFRRAQMRRSSIAVLKIFLLLAVVCSSIPWGPTAHGEVLLQPVQLTRIAPDLLAQAQSSPAVRVRVILQLNGPISWLLNLLLNGIGVSIIDNLTSLNALVVELPGSLIGTLAGFSEVSYISPDRTAQSLGHITA